MSGGMTADRFYGPSERSSYRAVSSSSRKKTRREPCHLTNARRLLGPPSGWKNFRRQQEALDYAATKSHGCTAFAYEQSDGQRCFMVAHPETFWHYDSRKPPAERHTYEIIAENSPCKLYFDLEFDRKRNPGADGPRMVRTFARIVATFVRREFDVACDERDALDLDSSTADKFSRHLIFQSVVFADNGQAGRFVRFVCAEIGRFLAAGDRDVDEDVRLCGGITAADVLGLKTDGGLFCDESVYSRNRHFRLYKSSKLKKNVPLVLSSTNECELPRTVHCEDCLDKQIFLKSLITFGCGGQVMLNFTDAAHRGSCPEADGLRGGMQKLSGSESECRSSYTSSPFPRIDRFISDLVFPGKIFRNHYFPSVNRLVYSIVKNRYCGNIKRQHKHNNVKYVVDLNEMYWYQKCYDPDCKQYRSEGTKLPDEICFEYSNREIDDLSDSQLVEIADTALLTCD